jgi:GTP cyclohydrolase IB
MNMQSPKRALATPEAGAPERPGKTEAEAALRTLLAWAGDGTGREGAADLVRALHAARPSLSRTYSDAFSPDAAYLASLPDVQNGPASLIRGARAEIQHVGISNFRLPVRYRVRAGGEVTLETSVTGTVSLEANKKGINMSRIMRTFYAHAEKSFSFQVMSGVLKAYLEELESCDARLQMRFSYPMLKTSLRSGLKGYQYYNIALETVKTGERTRKIMHLDYVYSSTCPCSLELAEHARQARRQIATPHSQRSVARLSLEVLSNDLWFEDVIDLCARAIRTETQVMVKREDEQAFAELNGANPIFVEDAVRLLCDAIEGEPRIGDFRVVASHQESLHSHDAISVLTCGDTFRQLSYDPRLFETLHHVG